MQYFVIISLIAAWFCEWCSTASNHLNDILGYFTEFVDESLSVHLSQDASLVIVPETSKKPSHINGNHNVFRCNGSSKQKK